MEATEVCAAVADSLGVPRNDSAVLTVVADLNVFLGRDTKGVENAHNAVQEFEFEPNSDSELDF
jgi:hypothetical protein